MILRCPRAPSADSARACPRPYAYLPRCWCLASATRRFGWLTPPGQSYWSTRLSPQRFFWLIHNTACHFFILLWLASTTRRTRWTRSGWALSPTAGESPASSPEVSLFSYIQRGNIFCNCRTAEQLFLRTFRRTGPGTPVLSQNFSLGCSLTQHFFLHLSHSRTAVSFSRPIWNDDTPHFTPFDVYPRRCHTLCIGVMLLAPCRPWYPHPFKMAHRALRDGGRLLPRRNDNLGAARWLRARETRHHRRRAARPGTQGRRRFRPVQVTHRGHRNVRAE